MTSEPETAEQLNPCAHCGKRGPYVIIRMMDCLVAECVNCRGQIDIGWSIRGYANADN